MSSMGVMLEKMQRETRNNPSPQRNWRAFRPNDRVCPILLDKATQIRSFFPERVIMLRKLKDGSVKQRTSLTAVVSHYDKGEERRGWDDALPNQPPAPLYNDVSAAVRSHPYAALHVLANALGSGLPSHIRTHEPTGDAAYGFQTWIRLDGRLTSCCDTF